MFYDLGYLDLEKDFPRTTIIHYLYRKEQNLELSQEEKEYNKNYSRKRIVIEHTIKQIKKVRIMSDIFQK